MWEVRFASPSPSGWVWTNWVACTSKEDAQAKAREHEWANDWPAEVRARD